MSRRTELDALRGLLLVTMALTHLPTRLRSYSDQPLGFVSAAEGFVFLSAFVAGDRYVALVGERGIRYVRNRMWSRAARVYGYHLALLLFAFTAVAAFAAITERPGLRNLLSFYFDSPGLALVSGTLLLYQPPLLDILPMYIAFLALSPFVIWLTARQGWRWVALGSVLLWVFAQLGARAVLHGAFCSLTRLRLPLEATGSFDLLAWQLLWVSGLWVGSRRRHSDHQPAPLPLIGAALLLTCGFLIWRHRLGGFWIDLGPREAWLDKWHLGSLRLLNFAGLGLVVSQVLLPALGHLRIGVLSLLGRASLQTFTAHLLLCLLSLGMVVDDDTPLSSTEELAVLVFTFGAMLFVAWRSAPPRASGYGFAP